MAESPTATPWAVLCSCTAGSICLTREDYEHQLARPNRRWICPRCGSPADWDDENYEHFQDPDNFDWGTNDA
jgi:hypothetical protein